MPLNTNMKIIMSHFKMTNNNIVQDIVSCMPMPKGESSGLL